MQLIPIAYAHNGLPEKFGVPRQSGLSPSLLTSIVFEAPYGSAEALRGLEAYSHLWLIWGFHAVSAENGPRHLTVRPPRLGGNTRVGVFATRSPFRPNPLGLSCVKLEEIRPAGTAFQLIVSGADLMDKTPIYDIKPYLPYADAHPEAQGSFGEENKNRRLKVELPEETAALFSLQERETLAELLSLDPRPAYQHDPDRLYGIRFAGANVRFTVRDGTLSVISVNREEPGPV